VNCSLPGVRERNWFWLRHFRNSADYASPNAPHLSHLKISGTRVLRDLPTLDSQEQALYDDLRNDRLGDRVRLEQERMKYRLVQKAALALRR
jgi:hypothetical protein